MTANQKPAFSHVITCRPMRTRDFTTLLQLRSDTVSLSSDSVRIHLNIFANWFKDFVVNCPHNTINFYQIKRRLCNTIFLHLLLVIFLWFKVNSFIYFTPMLEIALEPFPQSNNWLVGCTFDQNQQQCQMLANDGQWFWVKWETKCQRPLKFDDSMQIVLVFCDKSCGLKVLYMNIEK